MAGLSQEEQWGYCLDRGTVDQLFTLSGLLVESLELTNLVYMCFVDLEIAYNCVPQGIMWVVLCEYGAVGSLLLTIWLQPKWKLCLYTQQ